jgi:hypothetical protein
MGTEPLRICAMLHRENYLNIIVIKVWVMLKVNGMFALMVVVIMYAINVCQQKPAQKITKVNVPRI